MEKEEFIPEPEQGDFVTPTDRMHELADCAEILKTATGKRVVISPSNSRLRVFGKTIPPQIQEILNKDKQKRS